MIIILLSVLIGMLVATFACNMPHRTAVSVEAQETQTATALESEFTAVAEKVLPAVVRINVKSRDARPQIREMPERFREFFRQFPWFEIPEDEEGAPQMPPREREGIGSGWIYSADGYIVTNAHVIRDATEVSVVLHDRPGDSQDVSATVVARDPRTDLAVLKVDVDRELPHLTLGDSEALKVASWVMAVGAPLRLEQTVTVGVVSAKGRIIEPDPTMPFLRLGDIIQTDASINPGNSGGPLVNLRGEVVGINVAYAAPGAMGNIGIGFAIASSTAQRIIPHLIEGREIARGWLGVRIEDLTENLKQFYGVDYGIRIAGIDPEAPAAESDLQVDDIVIAVDGDQVRETWDLQQAIAGTAPGETVTLTVVRNGQEREIEVRLGSMPARYAGFPEEEEPEVVREEEEWPLGIAVMEVDEVTPEVAGRLGVDADALALLADSEGVLITGIEPISPAYAKIRVGDMIDRVNGNEITSVEQYREEMTRAIENERNFVVLHMLSVVEGQVITRVVDIELN